MEVWINYEAPAFTGESYYRIWTKKPVRKGVDGWYDAKGNTSHSFRMSTELVSLLTGADFQSGKLYRRNLRLERFVEVHF